MAPPSYSKAQWESVLRKTRDALLQDPKNASAHRWYEMAHTALGTIRDNESAQELDAAKDPGGLIATGLGTADYASFGLGPKIAKAIDAAAQGPGTPTAETYQDAAARHPFLYHGGGAVLSSIPTLFAAPTKLSTIIRGIESPVGRGLARLGYNTASGTAVGAAQAGGHAEGSLRDRLDAAKTGAEVGGALGLVGTIAANMGGTIASKLGMPVIRRMAGKYVPHVVAKAAAKAPAAAVAVAPDADAALRAELIQWGIKPEEVEGAIASVKRSDAAKIAEAAAGRAQGGLTPSGPYGMSGVGGPLPPVPTVPTIAEMQQGITAQKMARAAKAGQRAVEAIRSSEPADVIAARARIMRQLGFPASDAEEMARQGAQVPRDRLERILGRRVPGTTKWY